MKLKKKITSTLTSLLAILFLTVTFSCDKINPSEPEMNDAKMESTGQNINILAIGSGQSSLLKVTSVSEWITSSEGGKLELRHENELLGNEYDELRIDTKLEILPNTMSADAEVSLTIDDDQFLGAMDVVFSPHGTIFTQPALLSVEARGLDLSGFSAGDLSFYYFNEETGVWELMEYESFKVDIVRGRIDLRNAELPHFSRYAIGTE